VILDRQDGDLDRLVERHELGELEVDAVAVVLEPAVARPVVGDVRRFVAPDRQRGGAPQVAAVVVSDVDRLASGVGHGVIRPRRQLILAAVLRPGVAGSRFGDLEPKSLVGDDVEPRRRRRLGWPQDGHVFAPAVGEATQTVEELEVRSARQGVDSSRSLDRWRGRRFDGTVWTFEAHHLVGQAAPAAQQDRPGDGLQESPVLVRQPVAAKDVDTTVGHVPLVGEGGLARPYQRLEGLLEVLRIRGAVLVDDHEVDVEQLQPPVLVGPQELAHDVDVGFLVDPDEDDRQVPRDAVDP
jgi:hypothetical protein